MPALSDGRLPCWDSQTENPARVYDEVASHAHIAGVSLTNINNHPMRLCAVMGLGCPEESGQRI